MIRFSQSLAFLVADGILLGSCAFLGAADVSKVAQKEMKRLIDQLGSERFEDREQATQELWKFGKSALPSLKDATKSRDAEVRHRARQLIERMEPPAPAPVRLMPAIKNYL